MDTYRQPTSVIWLNGKFCDLHEARISPLDRGLMYGDGLFETLRSDGEKIHHLRDHLTRLAFSAAQFHIRLPNQVLTDTEQILLALIQRNRLARSPGRIKILVTRGTAVGLGLPLCTSPTMCMTAQPYMPPDSTTYRRGWRLHLFRDGFTSITARHKSLNYLFYLMARQAAIDAGKDEAVVLQHDGRIAETATGSLVYRLQGQWHTPAGPDQLPGITLKHVTRIMESRGCRVIPRHTRPNDLFGAECVWALNSLIGIMPVSHIDRQKMPGMEHELADAVRTEYFSR